MDTNTPFLRVANINCYVHLRLLLLVILRFQKRLCAILLVMPAKQNGGAKRDRTADLLRARQALSQLSYSPILGWFSTTFLILLLSN